jgi:hypothetical protein
MGNGNGNTTSKGPAFEAFTVRDRGENQKAWWTRIGTAFENRDGSLTVVLDANPLDGRIQLRRPLPAQDDAPATNAPAKGARKGK